jgi:hypothetical protein
MIVSLVTVPSVQGAASVASDISKPVPTCAHCQHRASNRHALEQRIPGLVVFGSGFGASVANSRLCQLHDQLVSPGDTCSRFVARGN